MVDNWSPPAMKPRLVPFFPFCRGSIEDVNTEAYISFFGENYLLPPHTHQLLIQHFFLQYSSFLKPWHHWTFTNLTKENYLQMDNIPTSLLWWRVTTNYEWHDIQEKQWSYNPNLDIKNQPNQGLFNQHIFMSWNESSLFFPFFPTKSKACFPGILLSFPNDLKSIFSSMHLLESCMKYLWITYTTATESH